MISSTSYKTILALFFASFLIVTCDNGTSPEPEPPDYSAVPNPYPIDGKEMVETDTGLQYYVISEGSGSATVTPRDELRVHYTGRDQEGDIFNSSYVDGNTAPVTVNLANGVTNIMVEGLIEGYTGMKVGESRVLFIPPHLAYENASESSIFYEYRNDTIRYDIKVTEIRNF